MAARRGADVSWNMIYYWCVTSIWTLFQCVNCLGIVTSAYPPKITHWNKCRTDADVWLYGLTLAQCRHECVIRTDCIGAQYHRLSTKCGLLTQGSISLQTCLGFVFVERQDMQETNPCGYCPARQACVEDRTCTITECLTPTVALGNLVSVKGMLHVGESVELEIDCGEELEEVTPGPIIITCQPNGTYPTAEFCVGKGNVWQSSTKQSYTAGKAVDGFLEEQWSFSSTEHSSSNRWWMYDIGALRHIQGVTIIPKYGRAGWLTRITALLSHGFNTLYNDRLDGIRCGQEYMGPPVNRIPVTFECNGEIARYVKLIKTSSDDYPLVLVEVKITDLPGA